MHFTTITTTTLLTTALLSSALPTGTSDLAPRACTTQYPTLIDYIYEISPDLVSLPSNFFEIAHAPVPDGAASRLCRRDVVVQFDHIPPGSYGCQLEAYFPAGGTVEQSGASQVDVFTVDKHATSGDTWNTAPKPVSLFGTVTSEAKADEVVKRVINSGVCDDTLTYRFTIASETEVGTVYFREGSGVGGQGLRLTYDC